MKNRRRMLRRFGCQKLVAALNCCFAAVVRVGRPAIALLAAIFGLLVELRSGKTVEGPHEQKNCGEGDDDLQTTTHSLLKVPDETQVLASKGFIPASHTWFPVLIPVTMGSRMRPRPEFTWRVVIEVMSHTLGLA
jgi:hypothetical protein